MFYDATYGLVVIGMLLCLLAQSSMKSTFSRYSRIRSISGITGAEAAVRILRNAGIYDVQVRCIHGNLTDHYNPKTKELCLSDSIYGSISVAALGVAAHECGHAIQHAKGYAPLSFRTALVPFANIGSQIAMPLVLIGFIFNSRSSFLFIQLGIYAFALAVLFQFVTLPVEFNASRRALHILSDTGMLQPEETGYTKKVLTAAALTYVAGAASSALQLFRLILLANNRRR
ncbi:MAG: zinc metallopeptidase [Dorea sp.]|nr:zinc metallopeptidase [Dorea sp.]